MSPIGAALLACAAAGFAWSVWVSLRGRSRIVVITLTAALAGLGSFALVSRSTTTTEHAALPPSRTAGGHDLSPATSVESATPAPVAGSAVGTQAPAVESATPPPVAASPVETTLPVAEAQPAVAPVAAETLAFGPVRNAQPSDQEPAPALIEVRPPPVAVPVTVEAPVVHLTAQSAVPPPAALSRKDHKKAPPGQEHPKKAKPAPGAQNGRD